MADAVAVVLDRAIGMDHCRAVLAVQVAAAKPFFPAAGEDAGRSVCEIKPALGIPPLDRAVDSDRSLVCHDRSLTRGDEIDAGTGPQRWSNSYLPPFPTSFAG